jgi:hypothetical protein
MLLRLLVLALFCQVSAADERRNAHRSGVSAVGCLYIYFCRCIYPRPKEKAKPKYESKYKSFLFCFLFWVGYWLASRTKLFVCPFSFFLSFFPSSFI